MTDALLILAVVVLLILLAMNFTRTFLRKKRQLDPLWGKKFDRMVLATIQDLGGKSYALTIQRRLNTTSKREYDYAKIYAALDRLTRLNFVHSEVAELTPYDTIFRGSRRRMDYFLTDKGEHYLAEHRPPHQVPTVFTAIK